MNNETANKLQSDMDEIANQIQSELDSTNAASETIAGSNAGLSPFEEVADLARTMADVASTLRATASITIVLMPGGRAFRTTGNSIVVRGLLETCLPEIREALKNAS